MAGSLPQSGIALTAQGAGQFLNAVQSAYSAQQKFTQSAVQGSAQASAAYAKLQASALESATKIATLTTKADLQRRQFAILKQELDETAQKYGAGSIQAQRKQLALDKLEASIKGTERALGDEKAALARTEAEMAQAIAATNKLETETEETGRSFLSLSSLASRGMDGVVSAVRGGLSPITSALKSIGNAFDQILIGALRRAGEMLVNVLADGVRVAIGWLKDAVGTAGDFEQTLNVLGATSGATAADLDRVGERAKELGADMSLPATSAQDAAEVMLELSKAGFTVQESMDAAKGALQLSAAAQVDAATAASITAGAINAFGLEASDAVRIADLLAAGANASSASMTDLSAGLQQAGFAFNAAGLPVEDLVTSLAALTNVGLTGSDAGTALKNALMRLMDPTDKAAGLMQQLGFSAYDVNGNMKPLPTLIADLNRAMAGMTAEERNATLGNIFLSDGMKAMIPLLDLGTDGFLDLKDAVTEQGAAATVANAQMQGWNGGIQAIGSQMETLQLIVGTFLKDALTPLLFKGAELVSNITTMADRFFKLIPAIQQSSEPFKFLLSTLALLNPSLIGIVMPLTRVYDALLLIITALSGTSGEGDRLSTVLTTLLGPLGATESAIKTGAGALEQIWAAARRVAAIFGAELPGATASAQGALAGIVNTVLTTVLPAVAQMTAWLANNLPAGIATAKAAFADVGAFVSSLMPTLESIVTTAITIMTTFWTKHGGDVQTIVGGAYTAIKGVIEVILGAIQGTQAIILATMTGDWQSQMGTIRASNETIWSGISKFLEGTLNIIAGFFGTNLQEIGQTWSNNFTMMGQIATRLMALILATIATKIREIQQSIANTIASIVAFWDQNFGHLFGTVDQIMSRAAAVVTEKVNMIKAAFSGIVSAIGGVISAVGDLVSSLSSISVPDIFTPGSPTPFEIGLRGINDAAAQLAGTLQNQFVPAMAALPARQIAASASGETTNNNYGATISMPVYTNPSQSGISQGLALIEAML